MGAKGMMKQLNFLWFRYNCYICGSVDNIVLHHVSYAPEEVMSVCSSCHGKIHHSNDTLYTIFKPTGLQRKDKIKIEREYLESRRTQRKRIAEIKRRTERERIALLRSSHWAYPTCPRYKGKSIKAHPHPVSKTIKKSKFKKVHIIPIDWENNHNGGDSNER